MNRILVTGCNGFLARHLIPGLRNHFPSCSIYGTSRSAPKSGDLGGLDGHFATDLGDATRVRHLVREIQPTAVFHLASQRSIDLASSFSTNVVGTANLLESVREELGNGVRVVVVGSAAEIGFCHPHDLPLNENVLPQPVDAYGLSKLVQSLLVLAQWRRHQQSLVRVRLFNLLGPDLPDSLLPGRAARLLAEKVGSGCGGALSFGDLSTVRDYTDVRDVCRALILAMELGQNGQLYHIGSGDGRTGRALVQSLVARAQTKVGPIESQEALSISSGVPIQVADSSRALAELGWSASISFEQSLEDLWQGALQKTDRGSKLRLELNTQ